MNLLLSSDANMLGPLATCLQSIALTNASDDLNVFILHGRLAASDRDALAGYCARLGLNHTLVGVDPDLFETLRQTMKKGHASAASLYRCKLASLLPAEIERVVYIDCDTLVLAPLDPLFDWPLGDATAAAVRTPMPHLADLGVSPSDYFNSGVMLIDLEKWRRDGVEAEVFRIFETMPERLDWWDQCALNIALVGKTAALPRKFNYVFAPNQLGNGFEMPTILHFAGATKPWQAPLTHPWGALYLELSASTPWPARPTDGQNRYVELAKMLRRKFRQRLMAVSGQH